jgi:membrane protease YdiL (CAAX protease family)
MAEPSSHCLVSTAFEPQVRKLALDREYVLGRDAEASIQLHSDRVSHRHAKLYWSEGAFVLEDLGSKNGVSVEGKRTQRRALRDGELISVGPFNMRYRVLRGDVERLVNGSREGSISGQFAEGELLEIGSLIQLNGLTGTLRIEDGDASGTLVVDGGVIVSASSHGARGLEAAREMLSAKSGRFEFTVAAHVERGEMLMPLGDLLIDALGAGRRDTRTVDAPGDVATDLTALRGRLQAARAELELAAARTEFGDLFAATLIVLFLYSASLVIVARAPAYKVAVIALTTMGFALGLVMMLARSKYPLRTFGITLHNWKRAVLESLVATMPVLLIALFARLAVRDVIQPERPLFILVPDLRFLAYPIVVPLQEVMLRGAVQTPLQRFLIGKHSTWRAIVLCSLFFGMMHLHFSLTFAALTVVLSIGWGWLYARHGTLLGVSVSHFVIGVFGYALWGGVIPGVWD